MAADHFALGLCERAGYGGAGARETFDLFEMIALDFGDVDGALGYEDEQIDATPLARTIRAAAHTKLSHPSVRARRDALFGTQLSTTTAIAPPAGFAATGMVFACPRCAIRFPARDACPRCGSPGVADLREPAERSRFLRALSRRSTVARRGPVRRYLPPAAIGAGSAGFSLYLLLTGASAGNALAGGMIVLLIAGLLYVVVSGIAADASEGRWPSLVLEPVATAALGSGTEESRRGHVHVRFSVRAPLSGRPCAAWRVMGKGPSGPIDDAGLGGFDVHLDGRAVARVEAAWGFVDLGPMEAPTTRIPDDALADFLRPRGRLPQGAACALSEAVLVEGDEVEVRGVADVELITDGMRESHEIRVFRSSPTIRALAKQR